MNSSNNSIESAMTRRNFMKKSALTVGAVTLLAPGIGLADGSSGMMIHIYDEVSTASDVVLTITAGSSLEAMALAVEGAFYDIPDPIDVYEYGDPDDYEAVDIYSVEGETSISAVDNEDGTFTVTITGPVVSRHYWNRPK